MTITARTGIWVQAGWMEHRGVPYAIRIGIGRDQWCVAVYPPGSKFPAERAVVGTREEAEATARSMINALLKKAIGAEALAAPEPILPLEERWTMTTAAEFRAKADQCERQAQEAKDVEAKRLLLEAAEHWRTLAAQTDQREQ